MPDPVDFTDLSLDPDMLIKLPGWDQPVPVRNIVPKAKYDSLAQRYNQREKELEGPMALQQLLNEDPAGLHEALEQRLYPEGREAVTPPAPQPGQQTPPPAQDPELLQAIAELRAGQQTLSQALVDFQVGTRVDREVSELQTQDPTVNISELMALAAEKRIPLKDAHRFKQADTFEARTKELERELEALRQEKALPNLGLGDSRNMVEPRQRVTDKRSSDKLLEEILGKNAQNIASGT